MKKAAPKNTRRRKAVTWVQNKGYQRSPYQPHATTHEENENPSPGANYKVRLQGDKFSKNIILNTLK